MPNDLQRVQADPIPDQDKVRELLAHVNHARFRNAMIGGKDNRSAEQNLMHLLVTIAPDVRSLFTYAEQFRINAVRSLASNQRIAQWIHCAPGFPAPGSDTHEIVQGFNPEARVLYVANDSTVALHSAALRVTNDAVRVIQADVYRPSEICKHPDVEGFLNWKQPIGLIYGDAWIFYPGTAEQAAEITKRFAAELPAGSYTVGSHFQQPSPGPAAHQAHSINELVASHPDADTWFRPRHQIEALFSDQQLLAPGLVNHDGIDPATETATTPLAAWVVSGIGHITDADQGPPN